MCRGLRPEEVSISKSIPLPERTAKAIVGEEFPISGIWLGIASTRETFSRSYLNHLHKIEHGNHGGQMETPLMNSF